MNFEIIVDHLEPETRFAWRWHPFDAPEGTLPRLVESGFDEFPLTRRMEAFKGNEVGWETQMRQILGYVEKS